MYTRLHSLIRWMHVSVLRVCNTYTLACKAYTLACMHACVRAEFVDKNSLAALATKTLEVAKFQSCCSPKRKTPLHEQFPDHPNP